MKKLIALFSVISFLVMNCATYEQGEGINLIPGQKPGAKLTIQKKDGEQVKGELITVKKNSFLLIMSNSKADVLVDVEDIKVIKIVRKQKVPMGAFIGGSLGAMIGFAYEEVSGATGPSSFVDLTGIYGVPGLIIGALIGGTIGAFAGKDKTIQIEDKSDLEIKGILEDLRKKARIPDF